MNREELIAVRLYRQHLTDPADMPTVLRDLNGLQAQFLSHAFHAARIRSASTLSPDTWGQGLIKTWTIRGTMHVFLSEDMPLFLHEGRAHFLRDVDTLETDSLLSRERKQFFADAILKKLSEGSMEREQLKAFCASIGMTEEEARSLFDPWGGIVRALAESGRIAYEAQERKTLRLCPPFIPMEEEAARLEILRRYFTHYGPATLQDASYYLGKSQTQVRRWMERLPLNDFSLEGEVFFYAGSLPSAVPETPACLLAAGFDPLLLGYEKKRNPVLPAPYLRNIFSLSGIVMAPVLLQGRIVGRWKRQKNGISISLFETVSRANRELMEQTAIATAGPVKRIRIEEPQ